jgi:hypothetical protein
MGNPQYIQDAVDNFEDLYGEDFLSDLYVESLGLSAGDLGSFATKFLDVEKYQTHLETCGWVFASYAADLTTHVFAL